MVGIPTKMKYESRGNDRGGRGYATIGKLSASDFYEFERGNRNVNQQRR